MAETSLQDQELADVGVTEAGLVDFAILDRLRDSTDTEDVHDRRIRQTLFKWTSDCEAVVDNFEATIKPTLRSLDGKSRHNKRYVLFGSCAAPTGMLRPMGGSGYYTVLIFVKEGAGPPVLEQGSHRTNITGEKSGEVKDLAHAKRGSVIVFDSNIKREDPAVKDDGAWVIIVVY